MTASKRKPGTERARAASRRRPEADEDATGHRPAPDRAHRVDAGGTRLEFGSGANLMPARLQGIPSVGPFNAAKLAAINIRTTDDLLHTCRTPDGRRVVSESTGLRPEQLLRWTRLADLLRVDGVTPACAELLLACDVDDVAALARRDAAGLADALLARYDSLQLIERAPGRSLVAGWIEQAGRLEPGVQT
jgi:hypothetical protein